MSQKPASPEPKTVAEQQTGGGRRPLACCDSLTASEWLRLSAWFYAKMEGQQVKPAIMEFTAGACRDAATAFEQALRHNADGDARRDTHPKQSDG